MLLIDNIVVANAVEVLRGHAKRYVIADHIKHVSSQATCNAHFLLFLGIFEIDPHRC